MKKLKKGKKKSETWAILRTDLEVKWQTPKSTRCRRGRGKKPKFEPLSVRIRPGVLKKKPVDRVRISKGQKRNRTRSGWSTYSLWGLGEIMPENWRKEAKILKRKKKGGHEGKNEGTLQILPM